MSLGGRKEVGRRRSLAYNEHTIIWGIRDSTWQDKSNQNAETIEAEKNEEKASYACAPKTVCVGHTARFD